MKTAVKPNLEFETFSGFKNYTPQKEKDISVIDFKYYKKSFIVLILLSTFLIFPESPRELENICRFYNSSKLCNVW